MTEQYDLIFLSGDATWSYKSWREGTMPVTAQPGYYPPEYMSPIGEWSTNLCDCCEDCGICLCGLCFPACFGCYVANKYGENCLLPCVPGGMTAMRTHMRLTYGIRGTVCNDSLLMCFCGWCETCRMAREVKRLQS